MGSSTQTPGERARDVHETGGFVEPRAGSKTVEKRDILPLLGNDTWAVQPVACSFTKDFNSRWHDFEKLNLCLIL
jgi:hypothetical protein